MSPRLMSWQYSPHIPGTGTRLLLCGVQLLAFRWHVLSLGTISRLAFSFHVPDHRGRPDLRSVLQVLWFADDVLRISQVEIVCQLQPTEILQRPAMVMP